MRAAMLQAMNVARLKLTSHGGLQQVRKTWVPGIDQQARWLDLQILAIDLEGLAIGADAGAGPFAAGAKICLVLHHAIQALLAPPLRHLLGVGKGLKDAVWRSRDKDLRQDRVLVGSDLSCRHSQWSLRFAGGGAPPPLLLFVSSLSSFFSKGLIHLRN